MVRLAFSTKFDRIQSLCIWVFNYHIHLNCKHICKIYIFFNNRKLILYFFIMTFYTNEYNSYTSAVFYLLLSVGSVCINLSFKPYFKGLI